MDKSRFSAILTRGFDSPCWGLPSTSTYRPDIAVQDPIIDCITEY